MITDPKASETGRNNALAEVGCSAGIAGWDMRQLGLLHVRAVGTQRFRIRRVFDRGQRIAGR